MVTAMARSLVLLLLLALPACAKDDPAPAPAPAAAVTELPTVTVDQLAALLTAGGRAVDANNAATRERQGVIPGATILSHFHKYDLAELPADRATPLVFYCANEECGASDAAAEKAARAGWTDVRVLRAGIAGWKRAGRETSQL
jgi:rhodanese-related sulfurtransferase